MNSPGIPVPGKKIYQTLYFHTLLLPTLPVHIQEAVNRAADIAKCNASDFNVVKINQAEQVVSLLYYDDFFDAPFPRLAHSWTVDIEAGQARPRHYSASLNPPILHRKELLLPADHPRRAEYARLTSTAEEVGLFDHTTNIGFEQVWLALIREKGYQIAGHALIPIGNDEAQDDGPLSLVSGQIEVKRHLTALSRYSLSAPMQSLARNGFLDGSLAVFDYGCGHGDDIAGLQSNGISVSGWDPFYFPENPLLEADIVNLGFVVNVIEDWEERSEALRRAFGLARRLLVVSVMLHSQQSSAGVAYKDGIVTQRRTFQKYYTPAELKEFISSVLGEEAIPVGPGIAYVFADKDAEQRFLVNKQRNRRALNLLTLTSGRQRTERLPRLKKADQLYETHRDKLDPLWRKWLTLGREPAKDEVDGLLDLMEAYGSLGRALSAVLARNEQSLLEQARKDRIADLSVYFALQQFSKRPAYRHLERGLQLDIRAFFGDYQHAQAVGWELLSGISSREAVAAACAEAGAQGLGWFEPGDSLILHTSLVEQLPPLLRVYVGCGTMMYGDIEQIDLLKIHLRSSKLSLLRFDAFEGNPLPRLVERIKINFRKQELDIFRYGEEYEPTLLYFKSRYINEEHPDYAAQLEFDERLKGLDLFDFSGYGPSSEQFYALLHAARWEIDGYTLRRSTSIPDLDQACGANYTYRDLIECGETQQQTGLANLPKSPETYNALYDLAVEILDPVIDYFGSIRLTYGFCSPELAKAIPGRIAPELDQHAGHECNRRGNPVCSRLGAAVDFLIEFEDMHEVAIWIAENLPYDRIYVYARDRPIHVSFSANPSGTVVEMRPAANGRRIPRQLSDLNLLRS